MRCDAKKSVGFSLFFFFVRCACRGKRKEKRKGKKSMITQKTKTTHTQTKLRTYLRTYNTECTQKTRNNSHSHTHVLTYVRKCPHIERVVPNQILPNVNFANGHNNRIFLGHFRVSFSFDQYRYSASNSESDI